MALNTTQSIDQSINWSKLNAFADYKLKLNEKLKLVLGKVENIGGKGEKCWLPAFSPFSHNVFKSLLFLGHQNSELCVKEFCHIQ